MSTLQGSSESLNEGVRMLREQVLPQGQQLDGFKGLIAFGDRATGKMIAITLWESEQDMAASEETANQIRGATAEAASAQITGVERFEVVLDQRM